METYRLRVFYKKSGISKFVSHRNFGKILERTLRRVDFPFEFAGRFHPHPKISFGPAMPIGIEGNNEAFDIYAIKKFDTVTFIKQVNEILIEGTQFLKAEWIDLQQPRLNREETAGIYKIAKTSGLSMQELKKFGTIVEETSDFVKIKIKLANFSHKELLKLAGLKKIERNIIWNEKKY